MCTHSTRVYECMCVGTYLYVSCRVIYVCWLIGWSGNIVRTHAYIKLFIQACMIPRRRGPGDGWIDGASFRRTVGCPTAFSALKSAAFRMHACADPPIDRSRVCIATARTPCKPPAASGVRARRRSTRSASFTPHVRAVCVVARGNNIYSPVSWACDARSRLASGRRCGLFPVSLGETWAVGRQRRRRMHRSGHCHRKEVGQRAHWACIYIQCHLVHSDFYSTGRLYGV